MPPGSGIEAFALPEGGGVELATELLIDEGWARNEETGGWENEDESLSLPKVTLKTSNVPELKAIAASIANSRETCGEEICSVCVCAMRRAWACARLWVTLFTRGRRWQTADDMS